MLQVILKQTLEEKDVNKDGFVDFQEYIGDRGTFFILIARNILMMCQVANRARCRIREAERNV